MTNGCGKLRGLLYGNKVPVLIIFRDGLILLILG